MAKKVFLGMSGGVDSSVSAVLLKNQGYDVTGIYMKNWSQDLPGMKCPWAEDLADAKRVAVGLGIDFEVWDFEEAYRQKVVDYMLAEFKKGRTPNPDIMCNQEIKFKLFYEKALAAGADFIATGHYARNDYNFGANDSDANKVSGPARAAGRTAFAHCSLTESSAPTCNLYRAIDENKDQTYFLYRMSPESTAKTIFPLGNLTKPEVKKMAKEFGLDVATKKESMGVCFVGEVGMKDFLQTYLPSKPGEIRDESEKVLGYHDGAHLYTIGQRHGLYLGGGLPYYVVKKDLENNIVYVSRNLNDANLWATELKLENVFWRLDLDNSDANKVSGLARAARRTAFAQRSLTESSKSPAIKNFQVRLRHRAPLIPATLKDNKLIFENPIKRPAPGQSVVFYDGELCLGGGIIKD